MIMSLYIVFQNPGCNQTKSLGTVVATEVRNQVRSTFTFVDFL